jgi:Phosphodiester glycosidase
MFHIRRAVSSACLALLFAACVPATPATFLPDPAHSTAVWTATAAPSATAPPPTAIPSPTASGWVEVGPGIERREFPVPISGTTLTENLILFRLDPAQVVLRVHYTPGRAEAVSVWARQLAEAGPPPLLVFNASFFTEDYRTAAFLVADGQADGAAYQGFGGMFSVQNGVPRVRSLTVEPWRREEVFEQAVQGTPVLVRPGRTPYTTPGGGRARRTALAQAADGSLVVVIAPQYWLTLAELAQALLAPELDLDIALNLDGGSSTGYWAGRADALDSDKPVPSVIAAYPK